MSLEIFAPLASFPNPAISRPTSAALFVRYFRQIPATGLYVFSSRVAIGAAGAAVDVASVDCSVGFLEFLDGREGKLYFVVMRVCHLSISQRIVRIDHGSRTSFGYASNSCEDCSRNAWDVGRYGMTGPIRP